MTPYTTQFIRSAVPALFILFCLTGCKDLARDDKALVLKEPLSKFQTIQPLDLSQIKGQELPETPAILELPKDPPATIELSLEQCRAIALKTNLDLKVELFDPAISEESLKAERAKFEASFSAGVSQAVTDTPPAADLVIEGSQRKSTSFNYGVNLPLQTGGEITFNLADGRSKSNFASSTFNPSYSTDFSASISQPLLKGAGIETNTHSIRIAEYNRQITDSQTKLEVTRVLAAIDRVYWRLYAAAKQLDVRKQQYELANAQLERARRFVDAGQNAQIEIIRAEAGIASRLEQIITAENTLRQRQRELKQALNKTGLETQSQTVIIPQSQPKPLHYSFDSTTLIDQAVANRMEMLELELQIAKDISNINFYRNQTLPAVTLDYTYNINGLGATRSDSYELLNKKHYEDHRLGLKLMIPLGNEAAKAQLQQAFLTRRQRLASKQNRIALIEVEVLNALDNLETTWQTILANRQSTLLKNRLYKAEIREFEIGMSTSTDVLEAQTDFADAQSAEINALSEYQIALVDLAYATGTLLGASQVEIESLQPQ